MAKVNGELLRTRRVLKRISQEALAEAMGLSQQAVSYLETGRTKDPALLARAIETVRTMAGLPRRTRTRRAA